MRGRCLQHLDKAVLPPVPLPSLFASAIGLDAFLSHLSAHQFPRKVYLPFQQSHFRSDLLMRLFGSAALAEPVSFRFMPVILAQKLSFREPPSGWGRLISCPSAFNDARPFSLRPPLGDLPSLRVHASDMLLSLQKRGHSGPRAVFLHYRGD